MMADMLRELHSEKSDKDASDEKDVPMGEAKDEEAKAPKSETPAQDKETSDEKMKAEKKASDKDDKKSSLRRTLERMLERK